MRIYMEKDYAAMSRRAALIIAAEIHKNPACVLGLATGSTPVGTYKELIAMNQAGDISFKEVATVNLDEYKGLSGDHDQSYRYFMNDNLFNHVNIDKSKTFVPNGCAEDLKAEGEAYDKIMQPFYARNQELLNGEWIKGWRAFCESVKEKYSNALVGLGPDADEKKNQLFSHYLDCEAHTDVWRELFPTWNGTNK